MKVVQNVHVLLVQEIHVLNMKGQMSFFIKSIIIILSILSFVTIIYFSEASRIATIEEKESSELKMDSLEILQKLVNTKDCLAYEYNSTTQKGNLDIEKIESFAANYSNFEPKPAKAVDFDYSIKIRQFPKNFTLYPGEKMVEKKVALRYLCSSPAKTNKFILISCNYNPKTCQGVCDACGEFDECKIPDCPSSCGKDPLKNCPYTGPCYNVGSCPDGQPPNNVCCRYLECPKDACEHLIDTPLLGHRHCWVGYGECNLSKCNDTGCSRWSGRDHGHCTSGTIEIPQPSAKLVNITIPIGIWGFGVGFGTSSFSPEAARKEKIELVLPVTIRYNETTSREGEIKIIAVRGELETITSLVEDVCLKAEKNPNKEIVLRRDLYFTYPVTYNGTHLQMLESYKKVDCGSIPINFENITQRGEYNVEIIYNGSIINVRT